MDSKKAALKPDDENINSEILDSIIDETVKDENAGQPEEKQDSVLDSIDLPAFILELELMFNDMLKARNENLGFKKTQLENHSKLAAVVIKKHLGKYAEFTPEIALVVTTLTMAASQVAIIQKLK